MSRKVPAFTPHESVKIIARSRKGLLILILTVLEEKERKKERKTEGKRGSKRGRKEGWK
jgi:hypothetical protein